MYWIFSTKWVMWKNSKLHASIKEIPFDPLREAYWWGNESVPQVSFEFFVDSRGPMLDNYATGTQFHLFSAKLIDILSDAGVEFEKFHATLYDFRTKRKVDTNYKVFRLLKITPIIDVERSSFKTVVLVQPTQMITKLVLKEEFLKGEIPMTRCQTEPSIILIHDSLKKELDKSKVTGCEITSLTNFEPSIFTWA